MSSHPSINGNNGRHGGGGGGVPSAAGNNLFLQNGGGGGGGGSHASAGTASGNNNNYAGGGTPVRNNTTATTPTNPPTLANIKANHAMCYQIVTLLRSKSPHVIVGQTKPEQSRRNDILREIYNILWNSTNGSLRAYPKWATPSAHTKKLYPLLMKVVGYLANPDNDVSADVHLIAHQINLEKAEATRSHAAGREARADAEAELQQRNENAQGAMGLNASRGVNLPRNIQPSDVGMTTLQMNAAVGALGGRTGISSGAAAGTMGLAANVSATAGAAAAAAARAASPFSDSASASASSVSRMNSFDSTSLGSLFSPPTNNSTYASNGRASSASNPPKKRTKRNPDYIAGLDTMNGGLVDMIGDLGDIARANIASSQMEVVTTSLKEIMNQRTIMASQNPPNTALLAVLDKQIEALLTRQGNFVEGMGSSGGGGTRGGSGGGGGGRGGRRSSGGGGSGRSLIA